MHDDEKVLFGHRAVKKWLLKNTLPFEAARVVVANSFDAVEESAVRWDGLLVTKCRSEQYGSKGTRSAFRTQSSWCTCSLAVSLTGSRTEVCT